MTSDFVAIAKVGDQLGECVLWDDEVGLVRWLDIAGKRLWQLDTANGFAQPALVLSRPACMAMTNDPQTLLVGFEGGLAYLDITSGQTQHICEVEADKPYTRLNDGRCDRNGNFVFGTFDEVEFRPRGKWYRYTAQERLEMLSLPPVAIPNSLCFSLDGRRLFFSDGVSRAIQCCDYDASSGRIENLRVFVEVSNGYPDGSTVDSEGYIWNAEWGNSRVVRYRPDGVIDRVIPTPVSQPTCVAFGGQALDTLYLTSARIGLSAEHLVEEEDAGALFQLRLSDVVGLRESRWGHA